jgi:hypothetical protein
VRGLAFVPVARGPRLDRSFARYTRQLHGGGEAAPVPLAERDRRVTVVNVKFRHVVCNCSNPDGMVTNC